MSGLVGILSSNGTCFSTWQKIKSDLNLKKSLQATMKTELQKAQQAHAQASQQYALYDLDLGKFADKVTVLTDRWQRIDKQIDFR